MTTNPPLRILIATPIDYDEMRDLVHDRMLFYSRHGCDVTLIHRKMNRSARLRDLVRDSFTFRVRRRDEAIAKIVAVDAFFNYYAGYRQHSEESAAAARKSFSLRLLLVRLLSPLTVLRDLAFVPCVLLAARPAVKPAYDVCLGVGPWGTVIGLAMRSLGWVSVVVFEDHDYTVGLYPDRLRRWYTNVLERHCASRADLIISVGHLLADLRRRQTGRSAHVIRNGVNWDNFRAAREAPRTGQRLIYVGAILPWSGVELAIRALPRVRQALPNATLTLVGGGLPGYIAQLEQLAREAGVSDCVRFLGKRSPDELSDLLGDAEIGLANSEPVAYRRYACPLKVLEYMAAGLPVITTEQTEAAEMVRSHDCGVAIPYEMDALAEAVVALFQDRDRYRELQERAIRGGRSLDWDEQLSAELRLIDASLGDRLAT